jgi:hypothetical protein
MPRPKQLRCCLFWQKQGYSYCVACMYSNAGWSAFRRKQNAEDNRALAGERLAGELAKGPKCRVCKKPLAIGPEGGQYGSMHKVCRDATLAKRPALAPQTEEKCWTDWKAAIKYAEENPLP